MNSILNIILYSDIHTERHTKIHCRNTTQEILRCEMKFNLPKTEGKNIQKINTHTSKFPKTVNSESYRHSLREQELPLRLLIF